MNKQSKLKEKYFQTNNLAGNTWPKTLRIPKNL